MRLIDIKFEKKNVSRINFKLNNIPVYDPLSNGNEHNDDEEEGDGQFDDADE